MICMQGVRYKQKDSILNCYPLNSWFNLFKHPNILVRFAQISEIMYARAQAKRLKTIMIAAAEYAALRLKDFTSTNLKGDNSRDRVFCLLDKNGDGKISIEELTEVMIELGAQGDDAREMMQLLDANSDGSLSSDEFDVFQKQVITIILLYWRFF